MSNASPLGGWDVHTHIIPPAVIAAAEKGRFGMKAAPGTLHICSHGIPLHPLSKVEMLVDRIRSDGLDGAIVSVPPPLFRPKLSPFDRMEYSRIVNDSLLSVCGRHAPTLRPFAYLPIEEPELAAKIADSLDGSWAGAVAGTELNALSYASDRYDPLWQKLSDKSLPFFIHPGSSPDVRLDVFYLSNLIGNPVETTIAAAHLVFAGVLHRFPTLKVILAHGGGCVAALCGRWQQGVDTNRAGIPSQSLKPREAIRRFYVDTLVHSATYLAAVIEIIGEDRILLGSDWPFPMGAPSAEHDIGQLSHAQKLKIRKANAENVFGARLFPVAT
jgi:aminocarboxymuconate-semialdehyde decarboxylase